ncbi:hypothetical protein ACVWWO_001733 [Bradyrhizobium sp. F1.13.1]
MIDASTLLRRALLADAIFSGVAALGFTFGASAFASLFNLPEALLRETGLFLIAYTALVGWLASRGSVAKPLVLLVVVGNAAWTVGSIALLLSGAECRRILPASSWSWRRRSRPACLPNCNMWDCAGAGVCWLREAASLAVVARLDRATQYSRGSRRIRKGRGVLDAPLSRGMTVVPEARTQATPARARWLCQQRRR